MEKRLYIYTKHIHGDEEIVSELNEKLNDYGLTITRESVEAGEERITINFDTRIFKKSAGRGAGAKPKVLGVEKSLGDLKEQIARTSAQEVADSIGVSRATLYRRMKQAENWREDIVLF